MLARHVVKHTLLVPRVRPAVEGQVARPARPFARPPVTKLGSRGPVLRLEAVDRPGGLLARPITERMNVRL